MSENNNNESKIRKVLFNEVSLFTGLIAISIGVVLFISGPDAQMKQDISLIQQSIETIETNDLAHIQKAIDENAVRSKSNTENLNEINVKLERILTLLGE